MLFVFSIGVRMEWPLAKGPERRLPMTGCPGRAYLTALIDELRMRRRVGKEEFALRSFYLTEDCAGGLTMSTSRFDYSENLLNAQRYEGYHGAFWPPADSYAVSVIALSPPVNLVGGELAQLLASLREAIEEEWLRSKASVGVGHSTFQQADTISGLLRAIAECLPGDADRAALARRADAVEGGYSDDLLEALASLEEDVAVVAGHLATWFGKHLGGMPTAFGCHVDPARQRVVREALQERESAALYLQALHPDLRLGDVPAFAATQVFFMAGEGNRHPKHIAYFLPADEGVKYSPFKKTYYFANTHECLLRTQSAPLADRFLDLGAPIGTTNVTSRVVPTLGVLAHELGHCVARPSTSYKALNAHDRWASAMLQEVAADVFGTLIVAEVWASRFGGRLGDVIAYYLAECLRYVHRGLGHFPDSDGMFLQLSYLTQLGALELSDAGAPRLAGDPSTVLAGLRSLARVLADALLEGAAAPAVELHRRFGPACGGLRALTDELGLLPVHSIEYLQDRVEPNAATAAR